MSSITTKGQIVIPSGIRKELNLVPGTQVAFHTRDGQVIMTPVNKDLVRSLRGKYAGSNLLNALKSEKAQEKANDDRVR